VTRNLIHQIVHHTHDASFFFWQTSYVFFCSLFDRSMLCSFHFIHIHLNGPALIYSSFLFLYRQRRLSVLLSISNFNFFSLFLLLFISMFLSFCHCLFFSPPHIFFSFIQCVCVCVYLKRWYSFFEIVYFEKCRSRKRMSSLYLWRRVRASFEMFGCWITQNVMNEKR
jgi:hypothetical protein